jgi:hypothetical protein
MRFFALFAVIVSMLVSVEYDKNQPLAKLGENPENLRWNELEHVWYDRNFPDMWVTVGKDRSAGAYKLWHDGFRVPVKGRVVFKLKVPDWIREMRPFELAAVAGILSSSGNRRFVGINVEGGVWPEESRMWPHLGMLYVGTVAKQENYEVVLWDELIQGPAPLEKLVQSGDIVGLSLVTTGIDSGVELARHAKELGANQVIAGNDAAMFRAAQLLRIPGKPMDAVFTSNSLTSIRSFFRSNGVGTIPHVARYASMVPYISNDARGVALERKEFGADDFFMIPDLGLFGPEYWNMVWSAYRSQFGHKHPDPKGVRNALALFAQGCGRASTGEVCEYCTIRHVANVMVTEEDYLAETLDVYKSFGINTFFNVTDSSFEMSKLADRLSHVGSVDSLVMYGRAQAIAAHPELLNKWLGVVKERLLINCGMDSADERILQMGINKSSRVGSRLEENKQAILRMKAAGPTAHLHYSLIFGSPGETEDSCKRNLEFAQWSIDMLGSQLDVVEGDIFWVNFGAPCSAVFTEYGEAVRLAALAGKSITREEWRLHFAQYANELSVPRVCERAWYQFFTNISIETAYEFNAQLRKMMEGVPGHVTGREFNFKPQI